MLINKLVKSSNINGWQILFFVSSLAIIYLLGSLTAQSTNLANPLLWLLNGLFSAFISWVGRISLKLFIKQREVDERNRQLEINLNKYEHQLRALLRLNQSLNDIQNENELMDTALKIIADIAGSKGTSFISLDEWGQTLPAYNLGVFPANLPPGWAERLVSERTRHTCSVCQNLYAQPGKSCPLLNGPFLEDYSVFCLPVQRGNKLLGLLNLYFQGNNTLTKELREILSGVLNEIVVAIQGFRSRSQELNTLREIQLGRSINPDFTTRLAVILKQLRESINAEFAIILIPPSEIWQGGLRLEDGHSNLISFTLLEQITRVVLDEGIPYSRSFEEDKMEQPSQVWAQPLVLSSGIVEGAIIAGWETGKNLDLSQKRIFQGIISQILTELDREHHKISVEYKIILQERKRLAREIHDSLAQTLAFIKLQTAQMQIFLRQRDFSRLEGALDQNYRALSEAYLQTREAIDNLRLKPEQEFVIWLEHVATDFEQSSGLKVITSLQLLDWKLLPEVQAQLVRIVQEALSNIRKHAGANKVQISMRIWEGEILLEICDDGKGFLPQDILSISQHGLRGMRERAELIGADFQIESLPQNGTKIRLRLPHFAETGA